MFRTPIVTILIASAGLACAAENPCVKPRPGRNLDRHEAICQAVKATPDAKLVFVGDSITQLWGGNPSLAKSRGQKVWAEHFERYKALNLGVSADKTENILWRLQNGALDGLSPKVFVLLAGTNNSQNQNGTPAATPEQTVEGLDSIVKLLKEKAPSARIVVIGLLPRNFHGKDTPETQAFPGKVNTLLSAKYATAPGISYLDLTKNFVDAVGAPDKKWFYDGLHLNEAGYEVWAKALAPGLNKLL